MVLDENALANVNFLNKQGASMLRSDLKEMRVHYMRQNFMAAGSRIGEARFCLLLKNLKLELLTEVLIL